MKVIKLRVCAFVTVWAPLNSSWGGGVGGVGGVGGGWSFIVRQGGSTLLAVRENFNAETSTIQLLPQLTVTPLWRVEPCWVGNACDLGSESGCKSNHKWSYHRHNVSRQVLSVPGSSVRFLRSAVHCSSAPPSWSPNSTYLYFWCSTYKYKIYSSALQQCTTVQYK